MAKGRVRRGGKKNRKFTRNKDKCKLYLNSGRREKNKVRRLTRHVTKQPNDVCAQRALTRAGKVTYSTKDKMKGGQHD